MLSASVPTPEWDQPPRRYAGTAVLGALFLGVLVPCLLTFWNTGYSGLHGGFGAHHPPSEMLLWDWRTLIWLVSVAGIFCGPGALILSGILIGTFRYLLRKDGPDWQIWKSERYFLMMGIVAGAFAAFANFPGYLVGVLLSEEDGLRTLRIATLFAVTGATCGTWIAWQVYREFQPGLGLFPRISLAGLIALMLGWGALLFLFQPA